MTERGPTGLVLAGAAALGAYQVGVLEHVIGCVTPEVDGLALDVLCGTSAGAIHVAALASAADRRAAVMRLHTAWTSLVLDEMLRPSGVEVLAMLADLTGGADRFRRVLRALGARGGLVDPSPVTRLSEAAVDASGIADNVRRGHLRAVAVTATRVATGTATVFHQGGAASAALGSAMTAVELAPHHVLASAAMPLLFPAIRIGDELYCDGGLRQMVPLSPALHLGARRVLMVSAIGRPEGTTAAVEARRAAVTSPLYLGGRALDAIFSEGVEHDVDRLLQINRLLDAGARRYGPGFAASLDLDLAAVGAPAVRPIELVDVRPSRDLGVLAAEYVTGEAFARRARGATSRVLRCVVGDDGARAGALLAYLLFDGGFAAQLIDLGRADARAQHDALVDLFGRRGTAESFASSGSSR